MSDTFPALAELIPHRGPAVLLDEIVAHDAASTTVATEVRASMQYVTEGRADAALALELMAQAVAVHVSLEGRWSEEGPRAGYIVGVPKMKFFGGDYRVGEDLNVCVRVVFHEGPIGRFEGEVTQGGSLRAQGSLTVFEPPLADSASRGDEGPA